jgi:hypothetical protein
MPRDHQHNPDVNVNAARIVSESTRGDDQLPVDLEAAQKASGVDQAWAEEIQRRRQAIRNDRSRLSDWDEVIEECSAMLPRDQWHARLNAMIASTADGNPDADFSRESIYNSRGE